MQIFDSRAAEFHGMHGARWALLLVWLGLLLTHAVLPARQGLHFSVAAIDAGTFAAVPM